MPIFVALEALCDHTVFIEQFAVMQFIVLDQASVYKAVSLLWLSHTDNQWPSCTTKP
jgi:hypothetical protein